MSGSFELRRDEETGRRYWWGSEDGWKDPTEIGEDGVLTISAEHFAIGTRLQLIEPNCTCPCLDCQELKHCGGIYQDDETGALIGECHEIVDERPPGDYWPREDDE